MGTWVGRTVVDIAGGVRSGAVDAADVVGQHLDQIGALDARVGAFVRVRSHRALAEAREVDARDDRSALPLAGVPVAVKDNIAVAGEPTRCGCDLTPDAPAEADHPVVRRLRQAGAVVVGETRMPELGVWPTSEDAHGVARNPWDLQRTPGGSSGGSAAGVAAAMVPAALGNDGLGSIRIPAACCGLVGIKPGAGVVPADVGRRSWRGMTENGPLTTTVDDAALLLSVMAAAPDLARVSEPEGSSRVAVSTRVPLPGIRVDREILRALFGAARALREAGHTVVRADPPLTVGTAGAVSAWFAAAAADEMENLARERLEPRQRGQYRVGRAMERWGRVRESDRHAWRERAGAFLTDHDVLLTPVMTSLPPAAGGWRDRSWLSTMSSSARWVPYPGPWNLAGFPAMTVPVAQHPAGLPIGVQLVAGPGGEGRLLAIARRLESALPWTRHAPLAGIA